MAWDLHLLDRAGLRLEFWAGGTNGEASPQAAFLRQAIADAAWDTVERHDDVDVDMEKIDQWEQENPTSNGREMIDDFRLRGSRTCRRRGRHLFDGGVSV